MSILQSRHQSESQIPSLSAEHYSEIKRINERELQLGIPYEGSWHQKYNKSAWVYVGGLSFELSEGDVLCFMSQFGEIEDINLIRDEKTGKSKGFAFIKYENQKSTVLAVDNMNGYRLLDRIIRVDHVMKYRLPKKLCEKEQAEDKEKAERLIGCVPGHAYEGKEFANEYSVHKGQVVFGNTKLSKKKKRKIKANNEKAKKDVKKKAKKAKKNDDLAEQKKLEWLKKVRNDRSLSSKQIANVGPVVEAMDIGASGWRGRYEPAISDNARRAENQSTIGSMQKEESNEESKKSYEERERRRQAIFGGACRIR